MSVIGVRSVLGAAALSVIAFTLTAPPAMADGPGSGAPTIVAVGDSYISGEAGRWAGSSNTNSSRADALGSKAYFDNATGTGEQITRCHRSRSAEIAIGGGIASVNLACSGATAATTTGTYFKPGLDFYDGGTGKIGQAKALQQTAQTKNVKMVVVSVGGNDFTFASIVQSCVVDFLYSSSWAKDYCKNDKSVVANFTPANIAAVKARVATALVNVRTAMRQAGYADSSWTMLVQNYPSPLPNGSGLRYRQSGYSRQNIGGCGFWNADADWANGTALPTINTTVLGAISQAGITNARTLDLSSAFNGRRLCETGVGLYEEVGVASWQTAGAVDTTEWVNQIRTVTTAGSSPYYIQESLHPNYWGQLALRSCVRQAYNGGAPRTGICVRADNGTTSLGEPVMTLR